MNKLEWYKKLAVKLQRINDGKLRMVDYVREVDEKIEELEKAKIFLQPDVIKSVCVHDFKEENGMVLNHCRKCGFFYENG